MIDPNNLPELPALMIPGPGQLHDADLEALGGQVIAHYGEVWTQLHQETIEGLGRILGCALPPYLIPGTGSSCLEAAALNLFEPGQRVLIADSGFFGVRLIEIATALGLEVETIPVEAGAPIDPAVIADAAKGCEGVMTVHVDTSTGVRHPIDEIAAASHQAGAAYLVDGIASAGGETVDVDGMEIDAFVTSTQKGLEAPPGLGVVALSTAGKARIESRSTAVRSWYLDLATWDKYRDEWGSWHPHPVTMPTNLVLALASSLKRILAVGNVEWIAERAELASYCRESLGDIGLKPVPQPGVEANLVVAAWASEPAKILSHVLSKGIMISGGLGPTHDKAIRIGLMGRNGTREMIDRLIAEISTAIR